VAVGAAARRGRRPQRIRAGQLAHAREQGWRAGIAVAALDPYRGYASALRTSLPDTVRVLDAFHLVRLGFAAVDDVRRRIQSS